MFVERLHPRDHDGKFAHGSGGGGSLHVVSSSRGGPVVAERGAVRARPSPAAANPARPAGNVAGAGDGVWSGSGLRHSGTINGRQYHLKRAGGVWSVFHGTPETGEKIGTAGTIADAKAHAHAHAHGGTPPDPAPARPPTARKPPAPSKGEKVTTSSRAARVSPTTAAKIKAAREAMPTDRDGWHDAALKKVDAAELAKLKKRAEAADKAHRRNIDKLNAIRDEYKQRTLAALKHERDLGHHTRINADGQQVVPSDAELESMADRSSLNNLQEPKFKAAQKKATVTLVALSHAEGDYDDAVKGQALPRTDDGLAMPSDELNGHLDRALDVGRAVLADAKAEFDRTAPPSVREAQRHIALYDAWAGKLAEADTAWETLHGGAAGVTITTPDGVTHRLTTTREVRDLEGDIRQELFLQRDVAKLSRKSVAYHQQQTLLGMIGGEVPFGGIRHTNAVAEADRSPGTLTFKPTRPRGDWAERLGRAEAFFPRSWLAIHAGRPLSVGTSDRAYYSSGQNFLSMPAPARDGDAYEGAFKDMTDEVTVHELGHRMEQYIPGLTAMEFAMVRRRATRADGTVEKIAPLPGYSKVETGQPDEWARPYAGKTYEGPFGGGRGPHETAWELFQVGLQDTFGRGANPYGRKADPEELQAFVLGALLTLR